MSFQQFAFIRCGLSFSGCKSFLFTERPANFWVCVGVSCPWSLSPSICIIVRNTNKGWAIPLKNTYGKDTGKIMTTPRRGHRQGCTKHLNFIPGIVTAFQSGLGQNYFFLGFSKRTIIGEGEEWSNSPKWINLFFAVLSPIFPFSWNYCELTG